MDDEPTNDGVDLRVTVVADPAELATLRRRVAGAALQSGADEEVSEDFQLAVSELATNVIMHADAATLTVVFQRTSQGWVLDVSNADALDDLDSQPISGPSVLNGRGLALARAVMDRVELIDIKGEQHIRCFRRAK